jgi:hypothetical protein
LIVQGEATAVYLQKNTTDNISQRDTLITMNVWPGNFVITKLITGNPKFTDTEYAFMNDKLLLDAYKRAEDQIYETALQSGILNKQRRTQNWC